VMELNLVNGFVSLLGAFAVVVLIVLAFAVMLGIIKRVDILKHIGALVCIVILLSILPGMLIHAWRALTIWQQIGLLAVGIGIFFWRYSLRPPRRRRRERPG
jgi:hypothetical protein